MQTLERSLVVLCCKQWYGRSIFIVDPEVLRWRAASKRDSSITPR